jgi:hypothetical protein
MRNERVMNGLVDLTGQQFGTLKVGDMRERRPQPRYRTTCTQCGAQSTASQTHLTNGVARCLNANCGKSTTKRGRDLLSEQRQQITERENQRRAEELAASAARMEADTQDYERPERYSPIPDTHVVLTQRQRLEIQAKREHEESEERERQRPAREAAERAEREQARRVTAQHEREQNIQKYWAQAVQESPDPKLFISPELVTASMSTKEATAHNERETAKFMETTPEYAEYRTSSNADHIIAYLAKNGVKIFDALTLKAAFVRLRSLGILTKKPAPAPQPKPADQPRRVNLTIDPGPSKPVARNNVGRDQRTGEIREFSDFEIRHMSSTEFKRTFGILPSVGELFTQMREER